MEDNKDMLPMRNSWINTPFVYIRDVMAKKKDLTPLEQDILFNVSGSIQKFLKPFYEQGRHKKGVEPNPLFTESDLQRLEPIEVRMSDYGINSAHYSEIRKAVDSILGIRLFIPEISPENGEMKWKWVNVFREGETTMKGDGYTYTDKEGMVQVAMRSNGVLKFKINPDVASYAFDMSRGYIQHPQNIVRLVNANHTPLFYTMLKHSCAKGNTCRLTVEQIKEHLGLVERDDEDRVVKYMIPKYSQFRKLVIEKVQRDLERMALEDKIDITFSFEEIRINGKKTGDPYMIVFTVKKSKAGLARDGAKHRENATAKLEKFLLKKCGDLDQSRLHTLIVGVNDEDFADFSVFAYREIWKKVDRLYPEDVASFVMKMMKTWIDGRTAMRTPKPVQKELFSDEDEPIVEEKKEEGNSIIPGQFADEWTQILASCSSQYKEWLLKATFKGGLRGQIIVHFRTREECDAFTNFEESNKELKEEFIRLYKTIMRQPPYGPYLIRGYDYFR